MYVNATLASHSTTRLVSIIVANVLPPPNEIWSYIYMVLIRYSSSSDDVALSDDEVKTYSSSSKSCVILIVEFSN
jgi:hypothetical protein